MKLYQFTADGKPGATIDLDPAKAFTIGRSPEATLTIDDDRASRIHAIIEWRGAPAKPMLRDNGSSNGVLVSGNKITAETPLAAGTRFVVGKTSFQFDGDPAATTDGPVAAAPVKAAAKPAAKSPMSGRASGGSSVKRGATIKRDPATSPRASALMERRKGSKLGAVWPILLIAIAGVVAWRMYDNSQDLPGGDTVIADAPADAGTGADASNPAATSTDGASSLAAAPTDSSHTARVEPTLISAGDPRLATGNTGAKPGITIEKPIVAPSAAETAAPAFEAPAASASAAPIEPSFEDPKPAGNDPTQKEWDRSAELAKKYDYKEARDLLRKLLKDGELTPAWNDKISARVDDLKAMMDTRTAVVEARAKRFRISIDQAAKLLDQSGVEGFLKECQKADTDGALAKGTLLIAIDQGFEDLANEMCREYVKNVKARDAANAFIAQRRGEAVPAGGYVWFDLTGNGGSWEARKDVEAAGYIEVRGKWVSAESIADEKRQALLEKGDKALEKGKFDDAEKVYNELIKDHAGSPQAGRAQAQLASL
jgi:hypothetical protein